MKTAVVLVIGAGVQGFSGAYHLAKAGISQALVVKKRIGAGSSDRSASMLMLQRETRPKKKEHLKQWMQCEFFFRNLVLVDLKRV